MKKAQLNRLLVIFLILIFLLTAVLVMLKIRDSNETRALFRKEISLFDRNAASLDKELLQKSVRSLYIAADTADKWLMLIKRGHQIGKFYGDYSIYLEASRKAALAFPKNPYIHALLLDSLLKHNLYRETVRTADTAILPEAYKGIITEAYTRISESERAEISTEIPHKQLIDNPSEESILQALSDFNDPRFILNLSILRAEQGEMEKALLDVPYRISVQFPEAYAVLAYDAKEYRRSINLIGEIERKFAMVPLELRHISYDADYLLGNRESAYSGYLLLAGQSNDWRPGLNLLLGKGAESYPGVLQTMERDYSHVYQVNWFLGDLYFSRGELTRASSHYRTLLLERPDIIEARIRIAEAENGYITRGRIRALMWDVYYSDDPRVDDESKENAALYLLWYALGDHDPGIADFFKDSSNITPRITLLLAVWETVYGNPAEALTILKDYEGPLMWLAKYIQGMASLSLQNFGNSMEFFESIETEDRTVSDLVEFNRARVLYYSGDYVGSLSILKGLHSGGDLRERINFLKGKIEEKL